MAASALWVEKYRPATVSDYVFRDSNQKAQVMEWIKKGELPNLMITGIQGTGKTALAQLLIRELDINSLDVLMINASRTNSVDDVRNKIINFIQMIPFGEFKAVILDECLHEDTLITVLRIDEHGQHEMQLPIKMLDSSIDLVKSFNMDTKRIEFKTFDLLDKGTQETVTIEFEDGTIVICTPTHKWYVVDENNATTVVKTTELHRYNHILTT